MLNRFVAFDLETTGLDPLSDKIIEIGLVKYEGGEITETFHTLVNPGRPLPVKIKRLTGLQDADLKPAPSIEQVLPAAVALIGDCPVIGHNISFDLRFFEAAGGRSLSNETYDTLEMARLVLPGATSYRLETICSLLGVGTPKHRALADADSAARLFIALSERLRSMDMGLLLELNRLIAQARSPLSPLLGRLVKESVSTFSGGKIKPYRLPVFAESGETESRRAHGGVSNPAAVIETGRVESFFANDGPMAKTIAGYEHRPQQVAMAKEIARALNEQNYLLVEAGTGVGKSMAYLLPLLLWTTASGQRAVVSTHTINLQEQLWKKDIPILASFLGAPFRAALVKGRSNYLCLRRWFAAVAGNHTPEEASFLARVLTWLTVTKTGDRSELNIAPSESDFWQAICGDADSCLGASCRYQKHCYINKIRRKAEEADLIIVNHSLLFTDVKAENRVLPSYGPLVIDEAHHLEDVATVHLGRQVSQTALNRFFAALGKALGRLKEIAPPSGAAAWFAGIQDAQETRLAAAEAGRQFFFLLGELVFQGRSGDDREYGRATVRLPLSGEGWLELAARASALVEQVHNLAATAGKLVEMMELWSITDEGWTGRSKDLAQTVQPGLTLAHDLKFIISGSGENHVYWVEAEFSTGETARHAALYAAPIDVGALLYESFFKNKAPVILTSATMSVSGTFQHYKERTGLCHIPGDRLAEARFDSPFAYDNQALLCINRDLPAPGAVPAEDYLDRLAKAIERFVLANRGRTMVLFTSHRALRSVYCRLKPRLEEEDICILGHGIDGGRSRILEEFKSTEKSVLLGSSSFWEGVDVPGEALSCVVIVKLPFWSPSVPVIEARLEDLARKKRDGFKEFSVPQAVIRFKQGFGRLIRTAADRGIVVILDRRILDKKYGRYFLNSLPLRSHVRGDTETIVKKITEWMRTKDEPGLTWQV